MNSHDFARELQKTVDHLLARPDVDLNFEPHLYVSFWDKEMFVAAARAMGSGKKSFNSTNDLHFEPDGTCLTLSIGREKVCRKVQDAKWECEPLFAPGEIEQLMDTADEPATDDIPF